MCGLFLTGPESRSIFKEARSLEVLTPDDKLNFQEFYELTLMDDGKSNEAKANVAIEMASR